VHVIALEFIESLLEFLVVERPSGLDVCTYLVELSGITGYRLPQTLLIGCMSLSPVFEGIWGAG